MNIIVMIFTTISSMTELHIIVEVNAEFFECNLVTIYDIDIAPKYDPSDVSGSDMSKYKPDERMALCFFFLVNKLLKLRPEENVLTYVTEPVVYSIYKERNAKPKFVRGFRCMATLTSFVLEVSGKTITGYVTSGLPHLPVFPPPTEYMPHGYPMLPPPTEYIPHGPPMFLPPSEHMPQDHPMFLPASDHMPYGTSFFPPHPGHLPYDHHMPPFFPHVYSILPEKEEHKVEEKKEGKREEKTEEKKVEKKEEKREEKGEEKKEEKAGEKKVEKKDEEEKYKKNKEVKKEEKKEKPEEKSEIPWNWKSPRRKSVWSKISNCLSAL